MMNVRTAELLISMITFFLAYLAVVTVAGAFRAWVAKKMGDDTAEYLGLLTLNPVAHIDFIGLFFLFIFSFGWGRYVPINPLNITGPWRFLKLKLAYFADTFAYFVSGLVGIVLLVVIAGPQMLFIARYMLVGVQNMSHLYLVSSYPELSSTVVMFAFIIIACIYLNVVLAVLSFILNSFSLLMFLMMERSSRYSTYHYYAIMVVPIILILLFSEPLRLLAINIISYAGYGIAKALRMA
jgi:hypothetical protein